ncbi:hypothetical protein [Candidatus Nanohalobium constans]|uniref:Uncharacterized protein n=1 Tax=Candidatus Nanohalobium constans TaxID=2565781 RepID=A0A5Q0UJ16_9ARCH|nr:hypothetical protein [Candidatus Nanohalobium constans]QGA80819.1 hypothetical protein LC1Nh_0937 [Candidatus Nanohalobium constans]
MAPEVSGFSNIISLLTGADAFSLLFPFILAWMLFLAAIEKAEIFKGSDSLNNAPPVMAMILAFFTARFLVAQPAYQDFFQVFFGKIVIGLASILGLLTLGAFTGFDYSDKDIFKKPLFGIAVLMAVAAFIWAGGFGPIASQTNVGSTLAAIASYTLESGAIWLLVIGGAIWAVMKPGGSSGGDTDTGDDGDSDG